MFALRDAIYLIELAFYVAIVPAIFFIIIIHGNKQPYTWRPILVPLIILSGLRIAGAGLGLAAMDPAKSDLLPIATLLDTIGLAPVLCLLIGLLIRANAPVYKGLTIWVFLPLHMTTIVATVMMAYGGRDLYTSHDNQARDLRLMRGGIFLFIAIFAGIILLSVMTMPRVQVKAYRTERAAVVCAFLCVPFMGVRLSFSAGSLFSGERSVLNPMSEDETSIWLHFLMVIVMEYIVTLSATAVSLTARRVMVLTAERGNPVNDEAS